MSCANIFESTSILKRFIRWLFSIFWCVNCLISVVFYTLKWQRVPFLVLLQKKTFYIITFELKSVKKLYVVSFNNLALRQGLFFFHRNFNSKSQLRKSGWRQKKGSSFCINFSKSEKSELDKFHTLKNIDCRYGNFRTFFSCPFCIMILSFNYLLAVLCLGKFNSYSRPEKKMPTFSVLNLEVGFIVCGEYLRGGMI